MIAALFPVIDFCFNVIVIQIPVVVMVPLPMRSYFHSATKKVLDHLRAMWRTHHEQFTGVQVMVQHLVMGGTSTLLTTPTLSLIPTQTLVNTTTILFQVEYKTRTQSWLGLTTSHLMRWRCFIWLTYPSDPSTHQLSTQLSYYNVISHISRSKHIVLSLFIF